MSVPGASPRKLRVLKMVDLPFADEGFRVLDGIAEVVTAKPSPEGLLRLIPDFDAYYCCLEVRVTKEIIDAARRLKVIATPSTGTDHIDMACAESRRIRVLSLRDDVEFLRGLSSTAELAWGLLIGALRRIPWGFDAVKKGLWGRDLFRGRQLKGKTLGILGYGRLGTMVGEYGRAFAMRVIACDIKPFRAEGIRSVDFDTLLEESDIISIHLHLTDRTTDLINRRAFAGMKDGVVLINTSRGAVIEQEALLESLLSGKVGAAGLDVIDGEWDDDIHDHPLIAYARDHDNLLITPHVGGVTFEAQEAAYARTAEKLREYLQSLHPEDHA